jgi:hypothetical protein
MMLIHFDFHPPLVSPVQRLMGVYIIGRHVSTIIVSIPKGKRMTDKNPMELFQAEAPEVAKAFDELI